MDVCFFSHCFENLSSIDSMILLLRLTRKYKGFDIEPRGFPTSELKKDNPFVKEILRSSVAWLFAKQNVLRHVSTEIKDKSKVKNGKRRKTPENILVVLLVQSCYTLSCQGTLFLYAESLSFGQWR